MNTEMAAASLSDDTAPSAVPSKPVADPPTSQALHGEEDACAVEPPPLKEASGEGGRRETDAEQVLQSVTDRLKELYPKEAMDATWLQVGISSPGLVWKPELRLGLRECRVMCLYKQRCT